MFRHVFTFASVASLLLCLGTIGVWFWSDVRPQESHPIISVGAITIFGSAGYLGYEGPPNSPQTWIVLTPYQPATRSTLVGPTILLVRCWKIAAGCTVLPIVWGIRRCRSRAIAADLHCGVCGYDLRATPDRCPECGHTPEKVEASA